MSEEQLRRTISTCIQNAFYAGKASRGSKAELFFQLDDAETVLIGLVQGMVRTAYFEGSQSGVLAMQVTP